MTEPYDWNPMPHVVDVRCPECGARAPFEFAELVRVKRRDDIPFFRESRQFKYAFLSGDLGGGRWHAAFYFQGLHGPPTSVLRDLPDGYAAEDWEHSQYLYRSGYSLGSIACGTCGLRKEHELDWRADAFFQIEYRGHTLWAFHRESAQELRDYVNSMDRSRAGYRWQSFLRHVPSEFLSAKARKTVVKRLDRLLRPG